MIATDRAEPDERSEGRATCYRCYRPTPLCYCLVLPRLENRTSVVIVQHPREEFHPINTARMVELSLQRCQIVRGNLSQLARRVRSLALESDAALLFPSADAIDLATLPESQRPSTVVILDGTWHHAKTLLRDLPELGRLTRIRFTPEQPSEYRIRKEPQAAYLSTLESVGHVLGRLEPELDVAPLYELFRSVIDQNIAARRPAQAEARFRFRGRGRGYRLPEQLTARDRPRIAVYAESARLESVGASTRSRVPLIVVAHDLEAQSSLRVLLDVDEPVRPRLLEHLGLTPHGYRSSAVAGPQARELLNAFLGDARLVAFHPSTRALLDELGVRPRDVLFLKGTYCDWKRSRGEVPQQWGSLDQICEREGLVCGVESGAGRAALRLSQTLNLFEFLASQA